MSAAVYAAEARERRVGGRLFGWAVIRSHRPRRPRPRRVRARHVSQDPRHEPIQLLVRGELDADASSTSGPGDGHLRFEQATEAALQLLEVLVLDGHWIGAGLPPPASDKLLGLADGQLALEHDGECSNLELGHGESGEGASGPR